MEKLHPKKRYGQHFLTDHHIAEKIASSLSHHGNYSFVLEIGPGGGMLTQYLIKDTRFALYAVEVEREASAVMEKKFPELSSRLIRGDFMKLSENDIPEGNYAIAGNFPYNISGRILFRVFETRDRVSEVVGMFQKEVADRIACKPGSRTYGILSVLIQAFYDVEVLFTVGSHAFNPPPKVTSAVIRLKRNNRISLPCDEQLFTNVVKTGFNQRRKTLRNALKPIIQNKVIDSSLLNKRAEALDADGFAELTRLISG